MLYAIICRYINFVFFKRVFSVNGDYKNGLPVAILTIVYKHITLYPGIPDGLQKFPFEFILIRQTVI